MSLFVPLQSTDRLDYLADEAAATLKKHLTKSDLLPTKEAGTILYIYNWSDECSKLVKELSEAKVKEVVDTLSPRAAVSIPTKKPAILLRKGGWLSTLNHEIALIKSIRNADHSFSQGDLGVKLLEDAQSKKIPFSPENIFLIFEGVCFQPPDDARFLLLLVPSSQVEVSQACDESTS